MVVVSGPFKGLNYMSESVGSELAPKLLGTYEKELTPVIDSVPSLPYDMIIDIGAAEGYYAVGLAKVSSGAAVTAFEATSRGRRLIRRMATINGVADRVRIEGFCDSAALVVVLKDCRRPLIVCDCEGGEFELLDPVRVLKLNGADILLEVHGRLEVPPGPHPDHPSAMAEFLTERFRDTHRITLIKQAPRLDKDWPAALEDVPTEDRVAAMRENRARGSCWLWMRARAHDGMPGRDQADEQPTIIGSQVVSTPE
jgi:hypothetical protein